MVPHLDQLPIRWAPRFAIGPLLLCWIALAGSHPRLATAAEPESAFKDSAPSGHVPAATSNDRPPIATALDEAERQIASFKIWDGMKVKVWAAEPMVANPVAISVDEHGRIYVAETNRIGRGAEDDRGHMDWLDDDMASLTVDDRLAMLKKHLKENIASYTKEQDRIRLLEDRAGAGVADHVSVFADGFNGVLQGIGAGVLAHRDDVYYTCIPNLWRLRDTKGTGTADVRESLHYGYGVRVSYLGHDLHGMRFGPDGKLYYSIGDRGANVTTEGRTVVNTESGSVFRCNPDGSELELFATGLRNPQKLAFDEFGNLFTCDNNSDSGDRSRWVYVVEGGDSGWRMWYQYLNDRGPFNRERIWYPAFDGQPAYIVPPVAWIADGPSGVVYYPGTGWDDKWHGHFFLCDFRGGANNSGVRSLAMKPAGASFEMIDSQEFLWHILATDVDWGPDGGLYVTDWIDGWGGTGKGRIYKVFDPAKKNDPAMLDVKRLIAEGMSDRSVAELMELLGHADMRIRQEAQFALAERALDGEAGEIVPKLAAVATNSKRRQLTRLHAIWALGQIGRRNHREAIEPVLQLTTDADLEVRAQAARVLGDARSPEASDKLIPMLKDSSLRVRHLAAIALGKLDTPKAFPAAVELLRDNDDRDPIVRHSAVMALVGSLNMKALLCNTADDNSPAVRMGALLALRRLQSPYLARFLLDSDPRLVVEAARAVNDLPLDSAMPDLARLIDHLPAEEPEARDALLRRVLNANFRLGSAEQAAAVAQFAARSDVPEAMRIEALHMLADWANPSVHDRVTNALRPHQPRPANIAVDAMRTSLGGIFAGSDQVRQVAAQVAGQLGIKEVAPLLTHLAADANRPPVLRIQAIAALEQLHDPRLNETVTMAIADSDATVRDQGRRVLARIRPAAALGPLGDALAKGTRAEQQGALAALGTIRAPEADAILSQWLDKLLAGQAPPELQLDLLEAAGRRGAPALQDKLARFESARPRKSSIDPFRETLFGGDAKRGRTIFFDRVEVGCVRCHTISNTGGRVGPDLTRIAAEKTREYLLESVVDPNKVIAKGFETVVLLLDDGRQVAGILKSEDTKQLVLITPEGKLATVQKSSIDERTTGKSAMPQDIAKPLSKSELRDLVEFLSTLK